LIKPSSIFGVEAVKNSLRFAVIGDWGTGDDDQIGLARQMVTHHAQSAFDFVVAAGDNIYPNGSGRYFKKKFEQPFEGILTDRVNFYAVLGNHDVQDGRQDQRDYPLFNMKGKCYYTLSKGDGLADFFMLDSTDYDHEQAGWFENALRTSTAKWKIVVLHHPLYSSGKKHGSNTKLRRQIEPLLTKYKVNVVFSGHDHMYERTLPQQGVQHFVTGAGGKTRRGGIDLSSEIRAASFDQDNHFMMIEVDDKRIHFKAVSEAGEIVDSGDIL
jgi:predicted phosphodiesterase